MNNWKLSSILKYICTFYQFCFKDVEIIMREINIIKGKSWNKLVQGLFHMSVLF